MGTQQLREHAQTISHDGQQIIDGRDPAQITAVVHD
jgi:hypothetical protein